MKITAYGQTDIGQCRQINEDCFLVDSRNELFAVADGVGGQPAGEIASWFALDQLLHYLLELLEPVSDPVQAFNSVIKRSNLAIMRAAVEKPHWHGMATTLVAAWLRDQMLVIANVGDSRAYLVRDQKMVQLTEDHNLHNEQQRLGLNLSEQELAGLSNVVTRALGTDSSEPEGQIIDVQVGDRLLLCSDGLTSMVDDTIIQTVIQSTTSPQEGCRMLIDLANRNGGRDNITLILVYFDKPTLTQKLTEALTTRR
ncbi:MAG: serine/threonine-protein phosphatase [Desulfuromonadales bacterium]|nr:serine/threonine-protein phosphatase [Desulfuromonadales bacterium]